MRNHEAEALALLKLDEEKIPDPVREALAFAATRGIWYTLSRNRKCASCLEAAQSRKRLGKIGIPIWDEIKSGIYSYRSSAGQARIVAVHCRGDRKINFDFLQAFLATDRRPQRLEEKELLERFGMSYGVVTPFSESLADNVLHLFDEDLLNPVGVPKTSMTNAGDYTWAIEFEPEQLASALPLTHTARITDPDPSAERRSWGVRDSKPIAIITGNGPDSGILLWQMINHEIRTGMGESFAGDVSMPSVTVFSVPEMGLSMELENRHEAVWEAIKNTIIRACVGGAQILTLACNTMQYYHKEIQALCSRWDATFVSMPAAVEKTVSSHGWRRVSLVGIKSVVAIEDRWSAFSDVETIHLLPMPAQDIYQIEKIAFEIKQSKNIEANTQKLRHMLMKGNSSISKSKKPVPILIALTELSLILRESGIWKQRYSDSIEIGGRQVFDTLPIYAKAIAAQYFDIATCDIAI